jgi:hypothetical protein
VPDQPGDLLDADPAMAHQAHERGPQRLSPPTGSRSGATRSSSPAGYDVTDREDTLTRGAETSEDLAADELAEAHT